jgi:hypothetical protein
VEGNADIRKLGNRVCADDHDILDLQDEWNGGERARGAYVDSPGFTSVLPLSLHTYRTNTATVTRLESLRWHS